MKVEGKHCRNSMIARNEKKLIVALEEIMFLSRSVEGLGVFFFFHFFRPGQVVETLF